MTEEGEPPPVVAPDTGLTRWKRALRPVMLVLTIAFIAWASWDLARRWEGGKVELAWGLVLSSVLPLIVGGVILAVAWKVLLERMTGRSVAFGPSVALHAESQMARYIPGKVGIPVVRMAGAKSLGVPAAVAGSSVIVELMSFVAVGSAVGFAFLTLFAHGQSSITALLGRFAPVIVGLLSVGVVLLVVIDRRRYPARVMRFMRLDGEGPLVPWRLPLLHIVYWGTWLAHGYLITRAAGADASAALSMTGLFVIAPIVGFLALAAPAGAGVREAVLSVGLVPALGAAPALAALLISRGATLLADVLVWLLSRPLRARAASP
ncbi:MAG: flippase-like domain-containing protein [Myxococcales bacterium]|nr:flippase-like domain-containing protein [Myxococcales bacterium]